jgi:hypothetical protein
MINNTTVVNSLYGRSISGTSTIPFVDVFMPRDPTEQDINYQVQQKWLNTETDSLWILKGFSSTNAIVVANWFKIGGPMSFISTITGNTGGPVPGAPITNNINVLGDGITVETTGTPGDYTLTISTAGTVPTSFVENVGTAAPVGGVLNVTGIQGVSTHGFANTVEVVGTPTVSVASSSLANLGTASFNSNHFSADANGFVSATNEVATEYATQSGFAVPAAGVLNIVGSSGITTSATGNTVTITGSGLPITSVNNQVFTTSGTYTPTTGMLYCNIQCLGGGGAGGGTEATGSAEYAAAPGGGAGEYAAGIFSAATIGASRAVIIGAAGIGAAGAAGGNGGNTNVVAVITALGGSGAALGEAGNSTSYPGAPGGTGGTGGDYRSQGFTGETATMIGVLSGPTIAYGFAAGGSGANSQLGAGGLWNFPGDGFPGNGYGSGGGGAAASSGAAAQTGGDGSPGIVIITEYIG